jgi:hypothetical protein
VVAVFAERFHIPPYDIGRVQYAHFALLETQVWEAHHEAQKVN